MPQTSDEGTTFDAQYRPQTKQVFHDIVRDTIAHGGDADQQARIYAERGKPDFAVAYLLATALPDEQKREVLAQAYEQRATLTEERAGAFDHEFHRPFPMLFTAAAQDRATARRIREGRSVQLRAGGRRQLPTL